MKMNPKNRCIALLPVLLGGASLLSCGTSSPARFYLVSSPEAASKPSPSTGPLVALEIVEVPAHLQRDPIATRTSPHELQVSEFDRWAEPLADALRRVIAETFEAQGARLAFPGDERDADLVLRIELVALDGVLGETLELRARWSALAKGSEELRSGRVVRTESTNGDASHSAWAEATSRSFQGLALELLEATSS